MNVTQILNDIRKEDIGTAEELSILYEETVNLHAKKIIDLGVCHGGSTRTFLLACLKTGGHVWSVDIKDTSFTRNKISELELNHLWTFTIMDDLDYVKTWSEGMVDIIMIDTSHTYEQTHAELGAYSKLVRIKGVIFLHDVNPKLFEGQVKRAINKFLETEADNWDYTEFNTKFGLGKLVRKK